jgi:hypothetical protein
MERMLAFMRDQAKIEKDRVQLLQEELVWAEQIAEGLTVDSATVDFQNENLERDCERLRRRVRARTERLRQEAEDARGQQLLMAHFLHPDALEPQIGIVELKRGPKAVEKLQGWVGRNSMRWRRGRRPPVSVSNAEAELDALQDEFNGTTAAIDRFRNTGQQEGRRATRRETNQMHGRLIHTALRQADERLAQLVEQETRAVEVKEMFVATASELTLDRLQWAEIVEVIEKDVQELARDVAGGASGKPSIEDLLGELAQVMTLTVGRSSRS